MNWPFWSRWRPTILDSMPDVCHSIEPLLSPYTDGMATAAERLLVEEHLPQCAECRAELAWMQATHRTLVARPIVAPPADLQTRIAEAIASSSSAPLRPARTFALRPAYAAAASLTVLGAVLIATMPHLLSPISPTSAVRPHALPNGTVKPDETTPAAVKHGSVVASSYHGPQSPLNVHRAASVVEHLAFSPKHSRMSLPLPQLMPDRQVAAAMQVVPTVSVPAITSATPPMHRLTHLETSGIRTASRHAGQPEARHPFVPQVIVPKSPAPIIVASLPKSTPTVPVNIGPSTVTTQPDAPRVHMASDILGSVRASVILMKSAGFATVIKSTNHTALNMSNSNVSDAAVEPITSGDFH